MTCEREQLDLSIARLYRAFRKCLLRSELEGLISAKPLAELSPEDLEKAGYIDPSKLGTKDLKHFLPRILELLISGEYPVRPEVVILSIRNADWRRWKKHQQSAIEKFLFIGWRYLLSESVPVERIDQWLCASLQLLDDPSEFFYAFSFGQWEQNLVHAAHFARLVMLNRDAVSDNGKLVNPYWVGREEQASKVVDRLYSGGWILNIDEIVEQHPYEPVAAELREAAIFLEDVRGYQHKLRPLPQIPTPDAFVREEFAGSALPTPDQSVTDAIDSMYDVFSSYGRTPDAIQHIGTAPLRDLGVADLSDAARDILLTWGKPSDFKHFLPRVCELMLEPGWPIRPEGIMFKMLLADYFMWPESERVAVAAYVMSVWRALLSDPGYPVSTEEWLCGASAVIKSGESDDEFLYLPSLWCTLCHEGSTPAIIHWARFITSNCEAILDGMKLRSRFCCDRRHELLRTVYWLTQADIISGYLHSKCADSDLPDELSHALDCANLIWEKRAELRSGPSNVATFNPAEALELAKSVADPWFRCQELAGVAKNTSEISIREIALSESFKAGAETQEPNRIIKVSSWPLNVLVKFGMIDWLKQEIARLLEVIRTEPHPYRRIDALNWILHSGFHAGPELYRGVLDEIRRAAEEAYGWKVAYLLLVGSQTANEFDHESAIEIALMIRNLRTRRSALRAIDERQLAEQYY